MGYGAPGCVWQLMVLTPRFVTCMGVGHMVLFAVSRWGLVWDALN